ncbi:E3 ubiquitin-protein ligase DZIP3 [Camelus dromedarius]|uniref:E3 ubiquitin-protein ligase DZIP3 n=1 Tax=Camelus dromedarius TaxID=9838 RepID=A0A5N4EL09_CAMDR|nr:E3 ubiquitin-protein ligase DZIP3 [Camelus dromedarius]
MRSYKILLKTLQYLNLLVAGIAWTVPAPVGEAVPPSTGLGSDLPMRNWEKITERLKTAFPQQTRKELTDFLRKLKDTHGKSLSGLTFDEIVNKISQFIDPKRSQDDEEEEEEPCVICHENLSPENLSVLPCAHKFHSQCIRPWLMQQGTCPTCRLHVLLPEEFPGHPSRQLPKI